MMTRRGFISLSACAIAALAVPRTLYELTDDSDLWIPDAAAFRISEDTGFIQVMANETVGLPWGWNVLGPAVEPTFL